MILLIYILNFDLDPIDFLCVISSRPARLPTMGQHRDWPWVKAELVSSVPRVFQPDEQEHYGWVNTVTDHGSTQNQWRHQCHMSFNQTSKNTIYESTPWQTMGQRRTSDVISSHVFQPDQQEHYLWFRTVTDHGSMQIQWRNQSHRPFNQASRTPYSFYTINVLSIFSGVHVRSRCSSSAFSDIGWQRVA